MSPKKDALQVRCSPPSLIQLHLTLEPKTDTVGYRLLKKSEIVCFLKTIYNLLQNDYRHSYAGLKIMPVVLTSKSKLLNELKVKKGGTTETVLW